MSDFTPQLEYIQDKPDRLGRNMKIVLFVFAGVMLSNALWSTYTLTVFLKAAFNNGMTWETRWHFNISGFKFVATLGEFFRLALGSLLIHVMAAVIFVVTAMRLRKASKFWPWMSWIISLPIAVIHISDIYAGTGAKFWAMRDAPWDWPKLQLLIYTGFHGMVLLLALAVLIMVFLLMMNYAARDAEAASRAVSSKQRGARK